MHDQYSLARDGGCTKPCCTVGAYGCQAHHADQDWAHGGNTNVDDMTLACGSDNRAVDDGGWQTRINARGECEWTPPPDLDHGQSRINYYHRPEALLRPPEDEPQQHRTEHTRKRNLHAVGAGPHARHPADPNHPTTKPPDPASLAAYSTGEGRKPVRQRHVFGAARIRVPLGPRREHREEDGVAVDVVAFETHLDR